jgi:Tol biopolymer transport system component
VLRFGVARRWGGAGDERRFARLCLARSGSRTYTRFVLLPRTSGALTPGSSPLRLGPYELLALIGRGGMGEVYRARDTRLTRTVAIKVLAPTLSDSVQARSRFELEARAIASLSHPNVCTVHDVGTERGVHFIVMEYLDGESLASRLQRGPLPFNELLLRGIEIVSGLEHAHAAGIVHRDVKPANIMLTRTGAKLLDFGLAALRPSLFEQDTVTDRTATGAGQMMGTLQYMAPEQVQGRESDARTDLFACGLVLYEMATGRKAFDEPASAAIITAILKGEPLSIREIQPTYSADLDWAIRRCLSRNPQERWQTAADLAAVLRWIHKDGDARKETRRLGGVVPQRTWRRRAAVAAGAAAVVVATWVVASRWHAVPGAVEPPLRATIPLVADAIVGDDGTPGLALSPDGRRLVYAAAVKGSSGLYVRRLDRLDATLVPGTEGAANPFFSADGGSVGFFAAGKLKTVALDGSSPRIVCDAPRGRGGSWETPNTIVFAPSSDMPLYRVAAAGGGAEAITTLSQHPRERSHRWPEVLPGGRAVLYTAGNSTDNNFSDAAIMVQSLVNPKDRHMVVSGAAHARYAAGHLLYLAGHALVAAPFDTERLELAGDPRPVVDTLSISRYVGAAQFAVSREGSLVYLPPGGGGAQSALTWVNRDGTVTSVGGIRGFFTSVRLSPDGRRAALNVNDGDADVRVYDLLDGTFSRVTYSLDFEGNPVWTPDGTRIAFASERGPGVQMFWKRWDDPRGAPGALAQSKEQDEALAPGEYARIPHSWSANGEYLAFTEYHPDTRHDIWILPMAPGSRPYSIVTTPFQDSQPVFSPDGKWVAYQSNESGEDEVYARPFQRIAARIQISTSGGIFPRWARNGELFYWQKGRMMAVTVRPAGNTLAIGAPRVLFEMDSLSNVPSYDVAADGQRFLMLRPDYSQYPKNVVLVHQWPAEMNR